MFELNENPDQPVHRIHQSTCIVISVDSLVYTIKELKREKTMSEDGSPRLVICEDDELPQEVVSVESDVERQAVEHVVSIPDDENEQEMTEVESANRPLTSVQPDELDSDPPTPPVPGSESIPSIPEGALGSRDVVRHESTILLNTMAHGQNDDEDTHQPKTSTPASALIPPPVSAFGPQPMIERRLSFDAGRAPSATATIPIDRAHRLPPMRSASMDKEGSDARSIFHEFKSRKGGSEYQRIVDEHFRHSNEPLVTRPSVAPEAKPVNQMEQIRKKLRRAKQRQKEPLAAFAWRLADITNRKYSSAQTEHSELIDQFMYGMKDPTIAHSVWATVPPVLNLWQALEVAQKEETNRRLREEKKRGEQTTSSGAASGKKNMTSRGTSPYHPHPRVITRSTEDLRHHEEELKNALMKLWKCFKKVQEADARYMARPIRMDTRHAASPNRAEVPVKTSFVVPRVGPGRSTASPIRAVAFQDEIPSMSQQQASRRSKAPSPMPKARTEQLLPNRGVENTPGGSIRIRVCLYCQSTGHSVRDCPEYHNDQAMRRQLRTIEEGVGSQH